jgi:hypothetical protein
VLYDRYYAPAFASHVNPTLKQVARHLVPVNFHEDSRYGHDRAQPLDPLPSLCELAHFKELAPGCDQAYLLRTRLRRQYNWVLHEVNGALSEIDNALTRLRTAGEGETDLC